MKEGLVVILDALGTKKSNHVEFLRDFRALKMEVPNHLKKYDWSINGKIFEDILDWRTFGDTMLISLNLNGQYNADNFKVFGAFCTYLLVEAFKKNIYLRGAMSYGKYVIDTELNSVLGEAVNDAATFYEDANWSGVVLTPRCSRKWQELLEKAKTKPWVHELVILQYPHPVTKRVGWQPWVVGWPYFLQTFEEHQEKWDSNEKLFDDCRFEEALKQASGAAVLKFENTIDFYTWYMKQDNKKDIDVFLKKVFPSK